MNFLIRKNKNGSAWPEKICDKNGPVWENVRSRRFGPAKEALSKIFDSCPQGKLNP